MIAVKKVGPESIPLIRELAKMTWAIAYAAIISSEQMKYMLELFYSKDSLLQQMQNGHQFIIASEENRALGFASYSPKSAGEWSLYRLHKIYIDPGQQGKGIGKYLLDFITKDIKPLAATGIELNVNRYNKALGFYQKLGFVIIKEEDIDIGNGYFMNDYVLNKII